MGRDNISMKVYLYEQLKLSCYHHPTSTLFLFLDISEN